MGTTQRSESRNIECSGCHMPKAAAGGVRTVRWLQATNSAGLATAGGAVWVYTSPPSWPFAIALVAGVSLTAIGSEFFRRITIDRLSRAITRSIDRAEDHRLRTKLVEEAAKLARAMDSS